MAVVNLWIAIAESGRGSIGLTREDVINALPGAGTIAITSLACWDLSAAMIRGGHLPIQFSLEHLGSAPNRALREAGAW